MNRSFVFFVFLHFFSFSSVAQKHFDAKLEKLIQNDEFEKAKLYLKKVYKNSNEISKEKYIYYNAKAGFVYLRLGVIDSCKSSAKSVLI